MSSKLVKIYLYHGENDYRIYKSLKDIRKELTDNEVEYKEIWGTNNLKFSLLYELLNSASLFASESVVLLRNISEGTSLYDFVEELQIYLSTKKEFANRLYIFNQGKVAKTTKIYKTLAKIGEIKEFTNPKEKEILDVIHKSIPISNDGAIEMIHRTNGNLFLIRNEIFKLKNFLDDKKTKIDLADIEFLSVKLQNQNEVWGIGKRLILTLMNPKDLAEKNKLIKEINSLLFMGAEPMMILYSFYNYILNFIKLKRQSTQGKGFKEALSLGYYFAKDFYIQKDKLDMHTLNKFNTLLLDYEHSVKSGEINEITGLKNLILNL